MAVNVPPRVASKIGALLGVGERLDAAGVPFVLGGSGLLAALGLCDDVGDWDLTTDAPPGAVARALDGLGAEEVPPSGVYHTERMFRVELRGVTGAVIVEVMSRLAVASESGVFRAPSAASGRWGGVALACPEVWLVVYALLGREERAGALESHLRRVGADAGVVAGLLDQPLPEGLARLVASFAKG